jgi:hypothetical protein
MKHPTERLPSIEEIDKFQHLMTQRTKLNSETFVRLESTSNLRTCNESADVGNLFSEKFTMGHRQPQVINEVQGNCEIFADNHQIFDEPFQPNFEELGEAIHQSFMKNLFQDLIVPMEPVQPAPSKEGND